MSDTSVAADNRQPPQKPPRPSRGRRVWRVVKWVLIALLALIVILIGLVAWVAGTDSGTEFAWHEVSHLLPGSLHVDKVKGRLIGPLEIDGLSYRSDTMVAKIGSIHFNMDFSALWHRVVHIQYLDVNDVDYKVLKESPPKKKSSKPFSLPKQIHLPVKVVIDRVSITNVTAVTAPKAKPVRIDRFALLGASLDNKKWIIHSLTGHGPLFNLNVHGALTPNNGYATALHAAATLRLPKYAPIHAKADISGSLNDLKLAANVASPYNISLNGEVENALKAAKIDAAIHVHKLDTTQVAKSLPKLVASADLTAKGVVNDLNLNVAAKVDSAAYGKATLDGALNYTPKQVVIHRLRLGVPATDGQLVVHGKVALAKGNAMNLAVDWKNLGWPLQKTPRYLSPTGHVALNGTLNRYTLDTHLAWQVVGQTAGHLVARGSGSMKAFDLKSLDITGGPGHITGHAETRWSPTLDVKAHLAGQNVDLGAIVHNVPSHFDFVTDVTASHAKGQAMHAELKQLSAHGTLRHQPLNLEAKAEYLGNHVVIDKMHLVSGAATADINGTFGWTPDAKLDGHWSIHSSDLSTIMPGLAGSLNTEGQVSGRVKAPIADMKLSAQDIAAFGSEVAAAHMDAHVDWSGQTRSNVHLLATGIKASGQNIHKVALDLTGTPSAHQLSLDFKSDTASAELAMSGSYNKRTRIERYTLHRLTAAYQNLAAWSLENAASGQVSAKAQSINNACLHSGDSRLCLTASHDKKASTAHIVLSNFDYDYAKPYFPSGLMVKGAISGTVDARVPTGGKPTAKIDLNTTAGSVAMTTESGEVVQILDMQPGRIHATMANNGLNASLDLPLVGGNGFHGQVAIAPGKSALTQHRLTGALHITMNSLGFVPKLSPQVAKLDGKLDGDIRLSGTLAKPNVLGQIALTASKIVLVSPGLTLTDVSLVAQGHGNSIGIHAGAKSGGGTMNVKGQIALDQGGQTVQLAITGNNFQVANIPEATAYVSPDLKVSITPHKVGVTGSVTIPKASITPKNLPASGVTTVSPDQVIVTQKQSKSAEVARQIAANVNVILGKHVHIAAFGLKADLNGNIRVVQNPGDASPTGTGAINIVNGSYKAYGQNLNIESGKILFAGGPISQPGLSIRAARYPAKDITVGVQVSGSVTQPHVELFSTPPMSQSEQLSWLLLGRSLDGASGQQSSLIARAALALGSSRGNEVLQDIGNKLGLKVGIGAGAGEASDQTALTVGKYLSPKLYVSYGIGLFDQVSTLSLRYTLSSHWSIQTSSSSKATGGDVIWTFDH